MTRVHANNGSLIGEFAREKRIYMPVSAIPQQVLNAFIATEDQNFYSHHGIDPKGVMRALFKIVKKAVLKKGGRMEGASTITQQVAKNFFLTPDRNVMRKIKEGILAVRIENSYSKEKILELYLNQIYFGMGAHGIAAASLNYFGKEPKDLTIAEMAYLAALPKGPANYHPIRKRKAAIRRRNHVIDNMRKMEFITEEEAEEAKKKPIGFHPRHFGDTLFASEYFAEEVRRMLIDLYGEKQMYEGGLSVHTTLDPKTQILARRALREGLLRYDRKRGYRGPVKQIDVTGDWGIELAKISVLSDLQPWRLGVVLETSKKQAVVGLQPQKATTGVLEKKRETVELAWKQVKWARKLPKGQKRRKRPKGVDEILAVGDVIYVAPAVEPEKKKKKKKKIKGEQPEQADDGPAPVVWRLVQIPKVSGGLVVMDPHTGRVLAIVGGFSFADSQFNRATQARRQPGSTFKPIVYTAALDNGYTPSSTIVDGPFQICAQQDNPDSCWSPANYEKKFYGPSTLRLGLEKSRNLMTVRLAQDIGMPIIAEYSRRFGVHDNMLPVLSMALGAGETTVLRMVTAYSTFPNGGKRVHATLIDRIQDRYGKTIYRRDNVDCPDCKAEAWDGQSEPPDLVAGVYVGFDTPKPMGRGATGGGLAAPIIRDFMKWTLADKPATPFRMPPDIKLVRINAKTGMRAQPGSSEKTILEAYKPNEGPADPLSYVTYPGVDVGGQPQPSENDPISGGTASGRGGYMGRPEAGGLY
ncbi:MAG: transglycosylase domain-containing protein [Alphaproteobacteria bacterium]